MSPGLKAKIEEAKKQMALIGWTGTNEAAEEAFDAALRAACEEQREFAALTVLPSWKEAIRRMPLVLDDEAGR